jgi:hypothetical protein
MLRRISSQCGPPPSIGYTPDGPHWMLAFCPTVALGQITFAAGLLIGGGRTYRCVPSSLLRFSSLESGWVS